MYFIDPQVFLFPTPAGIAGLIVSAPTEDQHFLCVTKADVNAFYHKLRLPEWMQRFCGLPMVVINNETW